jgi:hypothetical protein
MLLSVSVVIGVMLAGPVPLSFVRNHATAPVLKNAMSDIPSGSMFSAIG